MLATHLNQILDTKDLLLTEIYFELQEHFENKYGHNTFVLMEIGSFFEVYEVNNDELQIGKAKEIAELLNIQLTRKNKAILKNCKKNPIMAGVPSISLDRYLSRIIAEEKYTIVIIKQRGNPPEVTRYISNIISPGTNFEYLQDSYENYITSLLIDINNGIYSVGYSAIDVTTGKTFLYDGHGSSQDKTLALDEIFNLLTTHLAKEIILTFSSSEINQKEILRYLEIEEHYSYVINCERMKISYQNELFKQVYNIESLLTPIEHLDLEKTPNLSESLGILIDFIINHDSTIIQKLSIPNILSSTKLMYLGNNASEQLGFISKDKSEFTIFKLIDNTSTSMGKRLLKERLLNPITEKKELNRRYDLSQKLRVRQYYKLIDNELKRVYDLERLSRRINLSKLHPCELNYLYTSLEASKEICEHLKDLSVDVIDFNINQIDNFIDLINNTFNLELTAKCNLNQIDENFIKIGTDKELDELSKENIKLYEDLEGIQKVFQDLISKNSGAKNQKDNNFVTIGNLEKEGHYINITKNRFNLIEDCIQTSQVIIKNKTYNLKDFYYKIQTTNVKITADIIDHISTQINNNLLKISALTKENFIKQLIIYEKNFALLLEKLKIFIADIDVSISNIKTSIKYGYNRPEIIEIEQTSNFLQIIGLRHPLIEMQEEKGIYVPNDIILGDNKYIEKEYKNNIISKTNGGSDVKGILLYGINSSGKSSLMKSIGISIVLAQAGLFVPAKSMKFSLFDSVFTRIVSKDNLSKGLSTFAVEMLELKNIFNRATSKSIILGDEISHGTETLSGVSIVSSAILKLSKINSLFVFATHLHQLVNIPEIKKLSNIVNLHLGVEYSSKDDKLLFYRTLQEGSGSTMYGLEFAKSLHMDLEFLDTANKIRKRLAGEYDSIELLSQKKSSKYNKDLYLSKCAICHENVEEIHHIKEQNSANEDDFIEHFNKNHKHNLIPLCKKHHNMIHNGKIIINGFVMTNKGLELHYKELN